MMRLKVLTLKGTNDIYDEDEGSWKFSNLKIFFFCGSKEKKRERGEVLGNEEGEDDQKKCLEIPFLLPHHISNSAPMHTLE